MKKHQFEPFWKLYPKGSRRDGRGLIQGGKDNARKAWAGLSEKQHERAMWAVTLIKKDEFTPHAGKWLRQGYYESLLENAEAQNYKKKRKAAIKPTGGKDYEPWIMEQSRVSLETFLKRFPQYKWLVKKLRPELGF
jgi:hypothetical protein